MSFSRTSISVKTLMVLALMFVTISVGATSCGTPTTTSKSYGPPVLQADFSNLSWSAAFKALEAKMSKEYAFTQWKGVAWKVLSSRYEPQIAKAESSKDFPAYYTALAKFTHSIPDGHVKLNGDDRGVIKAAIGGGYGIVAMKLDNGQVMVAKVIPGSPADSARIKTGARIVSWGGKPATSALASTDTTFAMPNSLATTEDVTYARLRCMVRSPIGASTPVTVRNPGSTADLAVTMKAVDDGMEPFKATFPFDIRAVDATSFLDSATLPGNIGYIHVLAEEDPPASAPGDHTPTAELFKKAVDSFASSNATGLIVDVRGNVGGSDRMVTEFMSSFYPAKTLYEYTNVYNSKSGKMEIWLEDEATGEVEPGKGLYIEPSPQRYAGPVVVLVTLGTVSSGEGVALGIKNIANGKVMGFNSTNGSFGLAGEEVTMPEGLIVKFPFGQSLDKNKVVQVDSRDGKGGVAPDIRVPMNLENAVKWGAGEDPVLDAAVRYINGKSNAK